MSDTPFTRALGDRFERLPPSIRDHFAMSDGPRHYRGTMTRVWRRPGLRGLLAVPALRIASAADMLFAETGTDVGFSLRHRVQPHDGGPSMVWSREFRFPRVTRRFDAVMQYSPERGCIVDWLGGSGGLEVELHPRLVDQGIEIESGKQWLRLGTARLPLPSWIGGKATIREWLDGSGEQRIRVVVSNPLLGEFFGYEGAFALVKDGAEPDVPALVPAPGVAVPVRRWLGLSSLAVVGTLLVAISFAWSGPDVLERVGAAVGVGAGAGWVAFGLALLATSRGVSAVTWADACLRSMAVGMAILSAIVAINVARHLGAITHQLPATAYGGIVAISDVAMAVYFVRAASQHGLPWWRSLALWLLVLNGVCALVVGIWFWSGA